MNEQPNPFGQGQSSGITPNQIGGGSGSIPSTMYRPVLIEAMVDGLKVQGRGSTHEAALHDFKAEVQKTVDKLRARARKFEALIA